MSLLCVLLFCLACGDKDTGDGAPTGDGGTSDGGTSDGGTSDGGTSDGGTSDGGTSDGGTSDGGTSDGGTSDGGTSDGGTSDGGTSDGGTSGYTLTDGPYRLTVDKLIEDSCRDDGGGDALEAGDSATIMIRSHGAGVTIAVTDDLTLTGTLSGDTLTAEQVTSTDFGALGFDCELQYAWWIDGKLVADDHFTADLGLDYLPLSGTECDDLADADGGLGFPCGWSVATDVTASR